MLRQASPEQKPDGGTDYDGDSVNNDGPHRRLLHSRLLSWNLTREPPSLTRDGARCALPYWSLPKKPRSMPQVLRPKECVRSQGGF